MDPARPCIHDDCAREADFWVYLAPAGRWRPHCRRHLLERHPSLEIGIWLESGYARPVVTERPVEAPGDTELARQSHFRQILFETMGWKE